MIDNALRWVNYPRGPPEAASSDKRWSPSINVPASASYLSRKRNAKAGVETAANCSKRFALI
jgi:hypothetical protein